MPKMTPLQLARMLSKVRFRTDPNSCWLWLGGKTRDGYGVLKLYKDSKWYATARAHRVLYEAMIGRIPDGLVIDHLCRNRACCNPGHMEIVTIATNVMRGTSPAAIAAQKDHCARGHKYTKVTTLWATAIRANKKPKRFRMCRICKRDNERRYRDRDNPDRKILTPRYDRIQLPPF